MSKLKDLPNDLRPREKLLRHGAASLVDAELLAILLRTGTAKTDVFHLAQQLLSQFGGIAGLLQTDSRALQHVHGLGPAKSAELIAVLELSRRALSQGMQENPLLNDPDTLGRYLRLEIGHKPHEVFVVVFINAQHRLLECETMFRGTLSQASVYPREIAARALELHAAAVVLAHNHPSGCAEFSAADVAITRNVQRALHVLDIAVLDHLLITASTSVSMVQLRMMPLEP